jgi:hypothetical protein
VVSRVRAYGQLLIPPRFELRSAVVFAGFAALNIGVSLAFTLPGPHNGDWQLWSRLPEAIASGTIYAAADVPFGWSVPAAYLMAAVTMIGYWPWFALHYLSLLLLRRTPLVMGLAAVSWPVWIDASEGNTFTFAFVAGALALRGSRPAAVAYLALCALIPRPVQLPLALWLLWRMPELRLPAVAMGAAVLAASLGQIEAWMEALREYTAPFNAGPTRYIGSWWFIVGVPLAAWLTWRGRVGWAGLAISPYIMPYYFLVLLWELVSRHGARAPALEPAREVP